MHRIMSLALALVVVLGLGFVIGATSATADASERMQYRNAVMLAVIAGDYAPTDGQGILTDQEWDALLIAYGAGERGAHGCVDHAARLIATHDYTGDMGPCLGEEDSPAVGVLLGQSPE